MQAIFPKLFSAFNKAPKRGEIGREGRFTAVQRMQTLIRKGFETILLPAAVVAVITKVYGV